MQPPVRWQQHPKKSFLFTESQDVFPDSQETEPGSPGVIPDSQPEVTAQTATSTHEDDGQIPLTQSVQSEEAEKPAETTLTTTVPVDMDLEQ